MPLCGLSMFSYSGSCEAPRASPSLFQRCSSSESEKTPSVFQLHLCIANASNAAKEKQIKLINFRRFIRDPHCIGSKRWSIYRFDRGDEIHGLLADTVLQEPKTFVIKYIANGYKNKRERNIKCISLKQCRMVQVCGKCCMKTHFQRTTCSVQNTNHSSSH